MSEGVIYIASGNSYIQKSEKSARSVREHNPDINITLFTDDTVELGVFDTIVEMDTAIAEKGDSILSEKHFVYDKNLYLDADTYVCRDITDIFDLLDQYELAAAHNEARSWYHEGIYRENDIVVPEPFPEYNTGVMAYRDTNTVASLFEAWQEAYNEIGYGRNQPAFRSVLYRSDVNVATLPPEYNFMTHTVGFASGDVKIFHEGASEEDLSQWASLLNNVEGKKVTSWEKAPCRVIPNSYESRRYKLWTLDNEKIAGLLEEAKGIREKEGTIAAIKAGFGKIIKEIVNNP